MQTEYNANHSSSSWSERSLDHETCPHHSHVVIDQYSVLLNPSSRCDFRREVGTTGGIAMSISHTLKNYLDREHVHYDVLSHPEAFRALAIAEVLHTPEKEMAKVVIVKVEKRFVMTVLPAGWIVDLHRLRDVFMTNHVRLATEEEFKDLFPDCELGAMPPFGILYGLPVYVDQSLTEDDQIVFQAGTHSEAIRMRYIDFAALVFPVVGEFHRSPSEVW
jgi:Ala-tRNA(Pro) deacylase